MAEPSDMEFDKEASDIQTSDATCSQNITIPVTDPKPDSSSSAVQNIALVITAAVVEEAASQVNPKTAASKEESGKVENKLEGISTKERRVLSGMASLLQQMRSSAPVLEEQTETESVGEQEQTNEQTAVEEPQPKLNRKERRALMQRQAMEQSQASNSEKYVESAAEVEERPPEKIPRFEISYSFAEPLLTFKESASFLEPVPSFGFAASNYSNNYVKLAKFSPCGQYVASTSQDRNSRVFKFNEEDSSLSLLSSSSLGDLPYDAVWHPCGDLLTTTSRLHPIHLWNVSGSREASYRGINHLDELDAAHTMAFSLDGLTMYAGYNKCIRVFDVRRPGRQVTDIKTWRTQPYKEGQKALISSISVHPFFAGVYAVGTYGNTIGLYSDRTNFVECMFTGDFSAVTHVKYSPDGMKLYSCGRKSGTIQCFDLRNPGSVLFTMKRLFNTQQKVYFDSDSSDRYLFSGTSDGNLCVFDLQNGEVIRDPISITKIADCSVSCVSLHPRLPVVAACTGQRVFPFPEINDGEPAKETDDSTTEEYVAGKSPNCLQNSIQLWRFG